VQLVHEREAHAEVLGVDRAHAATDVRVLVALAHRRSDEFDEFFDASRIALEHRFIPHPPFPRLLLIVCPLPAARPIRACGSLGGENCQASATVSACSNCADRAAAQRARTMLVVCSRVGAALAGLRPFNPTSHHA